ncbi:MAG: hypothetical protein ACRBB6_04105 [Neptuniibacter sp.]
MQSSDNPPISPFPTDDIWAEKMIPIPNPFCTGMGFDYGSGSSLMHWNHLQQFRAEHTPDEDQIWSIVEGDDDEVYVSHGIHWINVLGYIVTQNTPDTPLYEDIRID